MDVNNVQLRAKVFIYISGGIGKFSIEEEAVFFFFFFYLLALGIDACHGVLQVLSLLF